MTRGTTLHRGAPGFDTAVLGTCYNARDPGVRPDVLVQANDVFDVIAAVKRAVRDGMKISAVSGGHSWAQNHLRDGGLLIDLSRLDSIEVDADEMGAVIGPGVAGHKLVARLMRRGLFFPTPHAPGVCMGGFLLQGGFGWGSRKLGLGCENVVGLDVVLADGRLVHASEQENADLFWAARGAGPGFFGVVVRFHLRLHRKPRAIGMALQMFRMTHLEEVLDWADRVGPEVAPSVEFQILVARKVPAIFGPGLEVIAPVLADSWKEAREATAFVTRSAIRSRASIALPLLPIPLTLAMAGAARAHFPSGMRWCTDNMWTDAPMAALLPGLRRIAETMPPAPSHALWLNWHPGRKRADMAFSLEATRYLAVYGEWRKPADDSRYVNWATDRMSEMAAHSAGIQLADENLARRPARFLSDANLVRIEKVREAFDPKRAFRSRMSAADRRQ
jgi:hypothetical protein